MSARLYFLMQNLIYPAFAGTLLYNFSLQAWWLITSSLSDDSHWSPFLWIASGLWFLVYFSCAFTEFEEFQDPAAQERFGLGAFTWNFFEVVVILVAALAINRTADPNQALPGNPFLWIGICWALVPITGAAANCASGRQVRFTLSIAVYAVLVAAAIAIWTFDVQWACAYKGALAAMSGLLLLYFLMLWRPGGWIGRTLRDSDGWISGRLGCERRQEA